VAPGHELLALKKIIVSDHGIEVNLLLFRSIRKRGVASVSVRKLTLSGAFCTLSDEDGFPSFKDG
jgi:hypothetical protein